MHAQRSVSWIDAGSFAALLQRAGVTAEEAEREPAAVIPPVPAPLVPAASALAPPALENSETASPELAVPELAGPGLAGPGLATSEEVVPAALEPVLELPPASAVVDDVGQSPSAEDFAEAAPEPVSAASNLEFVPPESTQERRFEVLLNWLGSRFGVASCFVADSDGLPLRARDCDTDIITIGSTLLGTWRAISRDSGFGDSGVLCVETGAGSWLFLMLAEGRWGRFCLGVGTRGLLEMHHVDTVRRAFRAAVEQ